MLKSKRKYFLLNYIFVFELVLLFLNDHYFKWEFSNWLTGKLSDFVGLLIFPFFLTFFFPKSILRNVLFTGLFFVFWKSPFSQGVIDIYNSIAFIKITRIIDYSDLVALSILPLSYCFLRRIPISEPFHINNINIHPLIILFPAIIVFMATSPPYWHRFMYSEGNLKFYKTSVKVKMSQEDILNRMETLQVRVAIDSTFHHENTEILNFYRVDELVINEDTINDLKFSMVSFKKDKTKIFLNAMNISEDIKEENVKNELRKYYRRLLKKYIRGKIK
ncbi:hypothetical protein [Flavivirga algicola]|uniref:Uncharacterized protein n=1 Tax=Flavivirga algicola TaxID=2729136 RepID=A0ABX1RZF7_9FLAO|nr:hypothetical protein [Flavivirga algicola]NMH88023.1 hypothetical protein [Flavivirga algicola]